MGLELGELQGSGPHGRIVKSDVEAANLQIRPSAASKTPTQADGAEPRAEAAPVLLSLEQMGVPPGSYELYPLDGMRKTIARRMTESFRDIPHFPLTVDLEIDRLLDARVRINAALEAAGVKISVNDILIKACALALKAVPEANASYTPEGLARHHHADIAVAVAVEGGLITPIVRRAEERTLSDISAAMKDLAERARSRKLKPEEFQGGTFTISNLGMLGIDRFSAIINPPQAAILAVGNIVKKPVVDADDQIVVGHRQSLTLSCDHRVVDGAVGAAYLKELRELMEKPALLLL
jgi:pyruvate dehydrogenase E2 component (dihydrolipoamide acetyltransferase)